MFCTNNHKKLVLWEIMQDYPDAYTYVFDKFNCINGENILKYVNDLTSRYEPSKPGVRMDMRYYRDKSGEYIEGFIFIVYNNDGSPADLDVWEELFHVNDEFISKVKDLCKKNEL